MRFQGVILVLLQNGTYRETWEGPHRVKEFQALRDAYTKGGTIWTSSICGQMLSDGSISIKVKRVESQPRKRKVKSGT